jgi:hypothetical protein
MVKKTMFVAGGAVLLLVLLFGRNAFSYVTTTVGWVHDSVKESVPIEFEIQRARSMITDLTPEIRRNMHLIAKEEVEVERLGRQIADNERRLTKERDELMRLKGDLDSGGNHFTYAGHRYSADQVKIDLANRFERYKSNDNTLINLHKVYSARQRSLYAARQKLEGMLAAKRQLEVDVENLEARLKMVEVAQTTSDFNFDNSHLARTKEVISEIRTRIEVNERLVNADQHFHDEIPLEEGPEAEDLSDAITRYFGSERALEYEALAQEAK